MQLEIGKRYLCRNSEITSPLELTGEEIYAFEGTTNIGNYHTWTKEGTHNTNYKSNPLDLVSEYIPPPDPREKILATGGTEFSTGAVRSSDANNVRYDLITPIGLRRIAETYKEGYDKYGAFNWEKGMPINDILNHALRHVFEYLSGDRSEDHLAHAGWNLLAAMHMEETHPEVTTELRPPKNEIKPVNSCNDQTTT